LTPELIRALVATGLLDDDTAALLARNLDPAAAQLFAEELLTDSTQAGLTAQQMRLLDLLQDTEADPTAQELAKFWLAEDEALYTALRPALVEVATEKAAASLLADVGAFSRVHQEAIDWVDRYYTSASPYNYGSIPNLNETTSRQVARAFVAWNQGELGGKPAGLPQLIEALTPTFGPARARTIGVTETTRIFAQATLAAARVNPVVTALRFFTAVDDRVCPICGPLHNAVIAKEIDGYTHPEQGMIGYPPLHVACRCQIVQETAQTLRR
jgi:hypothetical protein